MQEKDYAIKYLDNANRLINILEKPGFYPFPDDINIHHDTESNSYFLVDGDGFSIFEDSIFNDEFKVLEYILYLENILELQKPLVL